MSSRGVKERPERLLFVLCSVSRASVRAQSVRIKTRDGSSLSTAAGFTGVVSGRVEILHAGLWGSVCSTGWGMEEARVVCTQLGFPASVNFLSAARDESSMDSGTGPIWMGRLRCMGTEPSLSACAGFGFGIHAQGCSHADDAGVICAKVGRYAERFHHPDRLAQPLRRVGAKGSGDFVPVSWDDAFDEVADALTRTSQRRNALR